MSKADEIKGKNKVYYAVSDEDYGGVYIAAPNIKLAKSIARSCDIIADHMWNFLDLKIHWCRDIKTNYEGELDIMQINELGLTWWSCSQCDKEHFEIIDTFTYKCKKCGNVEVIPYMG